MSVINREHLITQLQWRYATKRFDASKKIPEADWKALEASLVLSPSSYGLQPYKFLVVQNPEIRKKLRAVSWGQSQVEDCSHYVVFLNRKSMDAAYIEKFIKLSSDVRGTPLEKLSGYKDMMMGDLVKGPRSAMVAEWAARQVYIAFGNLMTTAALLGVDACPLEGLEPPKYDEILNLSSTDYQTVAACALGYRHAEDGYAQSKKIRFKAEELVSYLK